MAEALVFVPTRVMKFAALGQIGFFTALGLASAGMLFFGSDGSAGAIVMGTVLATAWFYVSGTMLRMITLRIELTDGDLRHYGIFKEKAVALSQIDHVVRAPGRGYGYIVSASGERILVGNGSFSSKQIEQIRTAIISRAEQVGAHIKTEREPIGERSFNIGLGLYAAAALTFMVGLITVAVRHAYVARHP
jgi:hypothetical protein